MMQDIRHHHHRQQPCTLQESRRRFGCLAIGALVGILIQFSSLCSNSQDFYATILVSVQRPSSLSDTTVQQLPLKSSTWNNIGWSIVITTMGIILLLTLRALVLVVMQHTYTSSMHAHRNDNSGDAIMESKFVQIRNMEQSVATGTLWGVSMAWILTDYILGFSIPNLSSTESIHRMNHHMPSSPYWYVPMMVSGIALLAWHIVVHCVIQATTSTVQHDDDGVDQGHDYDDKDPLRTSLLEHHPTTETPLHKLSTFAPTFIQPTITHRRNNSRIHWLSFCAGTMIGIFIQCSTLGVTYMEQLVSYSRGTVRASFLELSDTPNVDDTTDFDRSSSSYSETPRLSAVFSFKMYEGMTIGTSFLMSCLGLILLLYIRTFMTSCVTMIHNDLGPSTNCDDEHSTDVTPIAKTTLSSSSSSSSSVQTFVLIHIEAYLATGTVVGLNIAWMVTDYTLVTLPQQFHSQLLSNPFDGTYWYQSILTLVVSTLWCPLLLYCTGFFSLRRHPNDNMHDDDIDDNESIDNPWKDEETRTDVPGENSRSNISNNNNILRTAIISAADEEMATM